MNSRPRPLLDVEAFAYPSVEIHSDRQMYQASALEKHGLTTIASFYSTRNLAALTALREAIEEVDDVDIRAKLLFAFTGSLTRASKRYQWSRKRPLNAANANYYVAPVFYEWNVFDLFGRKVEAAVRADDWLRAALEERECAPEDLDSTYRLGSADAVDLPDDSVDYVFTDPPFGSNLFYADMALFQEAWLGEFTDHHQEAVIDRSNRKHRTAERYEELLTRALSECRRILKPGGRLSMVFGNSKGGLWALVQRAIGTAGLEIEPDKLVILNKGQRSVKGLASGFENVATLDLVITMRPSEAGQPETLHAPDIDEIDGVVRGIAGESPQTPSHLYLELLRHGLRTGWDLSELDLTAVTAALVDNGWEIDPKSGALTKPAAG